MKLKKSKHLDTKLPWKLLKYQEILIDENFLNTAQNTISEDLGFYEDECTFQEAGVHGFVVWWCIWAYMGLELPTLLHLQSAWGMISLFHGGIFCPFPLDFLSDSWWFFSFFFSPSNEWIQGNSKIKLLSQRRAWCCLWLWR